MLNVPEEIKSAFHEDSHFKNIRIHFPNGERTDICNDLIVLGSVSFKESLCSHDTLKFGLCEGTVFECETVGVGNIKGAYVEIYCEIECDQTVTGAIWQTDIQKYVYQIPYGGFNVAEAKRQADMNHRRITAYGGPSTFYDEITNIYEIIKNRSFPSNTTRQYNPYAFLLAMSNIGLNDYSDNVFNVTDLTADFTVNTESGSYRTVGTWYYFDPDLQTNVELEMDLRFKYTTAPLASLSNMNWRDSLVRLNYNTTNALDTLIEDIIARGTNYGMPSKYANAEFLKPYFLSLVGNSSLKNDFYTKGLPIPFIFYPCIDDRNTVSNTFEFYSGLYEMIIYKRGHISDQYEKVNYNQDYIEDLEVLRLTPKESLMNIFTIPFEKVKRGSLYDFVPPDSFENLKVLTNVLETVGLFGYKTRSNEFDLIDIKRQFGLVPNSTLYPDFDLYPEGVIGGKLLPNDYLTCWYDDEYTKPFGTVMCKYKDTNNEEHLVEMHTSVYDSEADPNLYQTYDLSSNEFIQNTAWSDGGSVVSSFCSAVAVMLDGVSYMPVDFKGRGLPYVEAGDTFEILTRSNDSITTIVLNRTITGEQTLVDTYQSV